MRRARIVDVNRRTISVVGRSHGDRACDDLRPRAELPDHRLVARLQTDVATKHEKAPEVILRGFCLSRCAQARSVQLEGHVDLHPVGILAGLRPAPPAQRASKALASIGIGGCAKDMFRDLEDPAELDAGGLGQRLGLGDGIGDRLLARLGDASPTGRHW